MLSSLKKIFENKLITSFKLSYEADYYRSVEKYTNKTSVNKRDILIGRLIEDNSKILDIGCGDGSLLAYLADQKKHVEIFGIDISKEPVRLANERGVKAQCMDVMNMEIPDDWSFDYILMADFIEHIPEPEKLLLAIKDHFRKAVIISFPNIGYITSRLRLMIGGRFPVQWGRHPGEHIRFWTVKDFHWWVEQLGYQVKRVIPVRGPFLKKVSPSLFSITNIFVLVKK